MGPGLNDTGLTFGGSSIMNTDQDWDRGIPTNLLQRYLLQYCADVDEGIALCESTPVMNHGMNIMLTDPAENAVVVERSATRMAVRRMEEDAIWCANHYVTAEMLPVDDRTNADFRANSEGRTALLAALTTGEEETPYPRASQHASHAPTPIRSRSASTGRCIAFSASSWFHVTAHCSLATATPARMN